MTETPLIQFKTVCTNESPLSETPKLKELMGYCEAFEIRGFVRSYEAMSPEYREQFGYPDKGSEGNLSFKDGKNTFIITGSSVPTKKGMTDEQFARVVSVDFEGDECTISYAGQRKPSSESLLHDAIYRSSPHIGAIFHGHDDPLVKRMEETEHFPEMDGVAYTRIRPKAGTIETPNAVLEVLKDGVDFVVIRGHGFVSVAGTMEEAMSRYETVMEELKELFV